MSEFFQEEQIVYLRRAGTSWGPATEDDFSPVGPSLWHINSQPPALTALSFLVNLHFADLYFVPGKAVLGREPYVLAGAAFLAASARAEHRRVGKLACIVFSNADIQKYKNQKWSPSDSLFFKRVHSSADNRDTHIHTLRRHGQGGLNVKFIYTYGVLQPKHLNIKFLYVCFSTYASILHLYFSSRASDWPLEHFNGRHSSTSLSLVRCLFFWGAIADVLTPCYTQSSFFPFFHSSTLIDHDSSEEDNEKVSVQREKAEMLRLRFTLGLLGEAAEIFQDSHLSQKAITFSSWCLYGPASTVPPLCHIRCPCIFSGV